MNHRQGKSGPLRIRADQCCAAIIDYQEGFLDQLEPRSRARLGRNMRSFAALLGYFRIPTLITLERPVDRKGAEATDLMATLGDAAKVFEKDFFDLTKEKPIRSHLQRLKKPQIIVAGCETDVCVLQSCLGLLDLGFDVFAVDELLFSSTHRTDDAVDRLKHAGVVFVTYKTLFFELVEAVDDSPHINALIARLGDFPDDLPDQAEH
ncbi:MULTISPECIES: isochorismatase family protein [Rhodopseudomonas]|uniref:isochorismatase family protein n=1 Tax=Rhodopseudomonas TaxID=1073 RepID=UPI0006972D4C|nr:MULTISPECIES: isochorismatase family protein [Rhodopseudomonas]MDF3810192.1 isochorismatase family protein [Rhodopseudomonas sp. BAL398]WOK20177.1 isochorismatase family protein [Rhodopseudomonas sp. BAL398]